MNDCGCTPPCLGGPSQVAEQMISKIYHLIKNVNFSILGSLYEIRLMSNYAFSFQLKLIVKFK